MKHIRKRLWSILLSLVLVLGLVPGMNLTAYASPTETLLTTITATGKEQASYSTANVATVSFSYTQYGSSSYVAIWGWWGYGWSATVNAAEGYTITKCVFYDNADRTATDSSSPFVVETTEEDKTPKVNGTILADNSKGIKKIEVYGYATPAHTHDFTYSASGATITATCTAGCPDSYDTTPAILTIAAAGGIYDGTTVYSATVTNNIPAVTGDTVGSVAYYKVDTEGATTGGTAQAGAPTGAGYYYASVTLTSGSNTYTAVKAFTVAKIDPTAPTGLTATYGQKLSDVVLPTGWTWADSTQSVGNVVSPAATFKANFAGDDNYNAASNVDVTVTVNKAANPATVSGTASVTAGGHSVDLANNVTLNGAAGTVSYEISGEANGCTLSGSVLTSGSSAGSVTVNVTVAEDDNYNALAATPITVTVNDKLAQTVTASDVTATYGDTGKSVSGTTSGDGAISYSVKSGDAVTVDGSTGALTIVKAGTAVVTVTAAETATYAQATKDVNVTVNTKAMTVSAENVNVTVDGQSHGITVNVTDPATGYTIKYGTEAGSYTLDASPTQTEAGTKTVYYQVTADNYTTYTGSATVTVNAHVHNWSYTASGATVTATCGNTDGGHSGDVSVTLTINATGGTYTGSAYTGASLDATAWTAAGLAAPTIEYAGRGSTSYTKSTTAPTNVGDYTASVTVEGQTAGVDFTIGKASITPSVSLDGWTYGEAANAPSVTGNTDNGAVTFTYAIKGSTDFSATVPTNAGEYTVKATVAATNNYNGGEATADFTIAKATVTVTAEA